MSRSCRKCPEPASSWKSIYRECDKCWAPKKLGFGGIPIWTCYDCLRRPCSKCDTPGLWCKCCVFCGEVHAMRDCPNPTMGLVRFDFSGGTSIFDVKMKIDPETEQN